MRQQLREILKQVLVFLTIFLIGVLIYRTSNPYSYLGLENRILFVLVLLGIVLLYLYLEEIENRNRLFSVMTITANRLRESKSMRICEGIWRRSPSLIRTRVSEVLAVLHPYLNAMSKYILKQDPKEVVSYAFLGMLLMVALQSVFPQPSLEWARTPLMITAVTLGVITFYLNRDKLGEIEDGAQQEKLEENLRKMEFGDKYPRINRVWGVRWVVRWMYKEGWWYSGILFTIFLIAGFLRLWNLGRLGLWGDEGIAYIAIKNIVLSGIPYLESGLLYSRDYPHLYITAASLALIGKSEFALRLPSAIFGVFLVFVIYFLTKKILLNKQTALLSAGIIATHPWMVEFSRTNRSYIMLVFLLYFSLFYLYKGYYEDESKKTNLIIFGCLGFITTLTHQLGQIIVFFIPVVLHRLKFKKSNIIYVLPFFLIAFGVLIYRYLSTIGIMYSIDQHNENVGGIIQSLIELSPFGIPNIENLDIFIRVIPNFFIASIFGAFFCIIMAIITKNNKRYTYFPLIFLIFVATVFFSEKIVTINRAILHIFPIIVILATFVISHPMKFPPKNQLTNALFTITLVFILAFYSFASYSTIVDRNYGDPVNPNYSLFEGFVFYPDHKTTAEFVNTYFETGDIIIVYQDPNYWVYYGTHLPNYKVWTGTSFTIDGRDVYTNITQIGNIDQLKQLVESTNRTWIVTSYSAKRAYRINHISPSLINYLNGFEDDIVYVSKDTSAKVYLIKQ